MVERRCRSEPAARCGRAPIVAVTVADLHVESIGILDVKALEVAAAVVRYGVQPASLKRCFDGPGIPWLDAPADVVEDRVSRHERSHLKASGARTLCPALVLSTLGRHFGRRRPIPAPKDDGAPVADVQHDFVAIGLPDVPIHQGVVIGGLFLLVLHPAGQVI